MKAKRIITIIAYLLAMVSTWAQDVNRLYIPDIEVNGGSNFVLPVHVQNTNSNIAGLQFTLTLPGGVTLRNDEVELTERAANHKVRRHSLSSQKLTVRVFS